MATNKKRKKKAEVMAEDGSMTLTGHLKELRNRLIICAFLPFLAGVRRAARLCCPMYTEKWCTEC